MFSDPYFHYYFAFIYFQFLDSGIIFQSLLELCVTQVLFFSLLVPFGGRIRDIQRFPRLELSCQCFLFAFTSHALGMSGFPIRKLLDYGIMEVFTSLFLTEEYAVTDLRQVIHAASVPPLSHVLGLCQHPTSELPIMQHFRSSRLNTILSLIQQQVFRILDLLTERPSMPLC